MSQVTLNLWDAEKVEFQGNQIVIETPTLQVRIELPEDWDKEPEAHSIEEETQLELHCPHDLIMHKLSGGCMSCSCTYDRFGVEVINGTSS